MKKLMLFAITAFFVGQSNVSNAEAQQTIDAVEKGDLKEVKKLLEEGASPDTQEKIGGHTLLQMAVTQRLLLAPKNPVEIVQALLEAKANPNLVSNAGNTPLIYAVKYALRLGSENALTIVKLLLSNGAKTDIKNKKGETVATFVNNLRKLVSDFDSLLKTSAGQFNGSNRTDEGKNSQQIIDAVENGDTKEVTKLLTEGASPDTQEKDGGHTLLQMAITQRLLLAPKNPVEIVQALLEAKANPNLVSNAGNTPLIYAVKHAGRLGSENALTIVKLLLSKGAITDIKNKKGETVATFVNNLRKLVDGFDSLLKTAPEKA